MIVDELRIIGSTQTNVVMAAELSRVVKRALKRRPPEVRKEGLGQLVMPFDAELAWATVTYLRTPTRVLWDVYRSTADRLEPLYDELVADVRGDTRQLWRSGDGISVEARHVEAFAAGERQVVGTVKNALIDAAGRRGARLHVDPERPATRWVARLDDQQRLVVSLDLGGGSLSQRGWRRDAGPAPLREHLAAVLLMLCRFDPRSDILVDPMCGSGTIPIEAVHAARATPRESSVLEALELDQPAEPLFPDARPLIIGCDLDIEVLNVARSNARAAGVIDDVIWQRADVTTLRPSTIADIARERGHSGDTGLLIANPPYGERLDEGDLRELYARLGETCRRFAGWRAGFLVGNPWLEQELGRTLGRPRIKKPLANANLRAYFYLYEL
ncbi:MAG: class I SAM-dependent RNA methyltransferase [Kofleriaceae bacterium]